MSKWQSHDFNLVVKHYTAKIKSDKTCESTVQMTIPPTKALLRILEP